MKKNKYLILLNLIVIGCTTTPISNVKPDNPQSSPTLKPVSEKSVLPTSSPIVTKTPEPIVTITATPAGTGIINQTPIPTPAISNVETSQLQLISGYIKTPNNAFLVVKPFELKMKLSLDKLPVPNTSAIVTLFELYDTDSDPKNSHYSLSLDDNKSFILKAKNSKELVNQNIPFSEIETGRFYEITFRRDNEKIELFVDNKLLFTRDFKDNDFIDKEGRRVLNIGADLKGENSVSATFDFVEVKDISYYDFKNNLYDSKKYILDATGSGEMKFLLGTPAPTAVPTIIPVATPIPSPTPIVTRDVKDRSSEKLTMNLNMYNPKDQNQYGACLEKKRIQGINGISNEIQIDCINGYNQYISDGFDFGSGQALKNEPGDMRFITYIDQVGTQLTMTGNSSSPEVLIIDIGAKIFDGIDATYLADKVDYSNSNKIFSSSNASSNIIEDHVYAIRTYRYGLKPRYAKVIINKIITDDYEDLDFNPPKIISQPQFIPITETSRFLTTSTYSYYISVFDGTGETVPFHLNDLAPNATAAQSKVKFSFELPYNSRGYTIYKKDNNKIYQIGPIIAKAETTINFEDYGNKGIEIDRIPSQDTTTKSAFKPTTLSRPVEINFSYYFDGDGNLNFN